MTGSVEARTPFLVFFDLGVDLGVGCFEGVLWSLGIKSLGGVLGE